MERIPLQDLLKQTNSFYKLVILAAKRAVELNSGAGKLIDVSPGTKLPLIALEEIRQGRVRIKSTEGKKKEKKK